MKRRTAALAAVLLVSALYLLSNPPVAGSLASNVGVVGTDSVYDKTSIVSIRPQNYSFVDTKLAQGDSMGVSLTANPGDVDVLLMDQGNFSNLTSGARGPYSTYPQSHLHVSNYSFVFTNGGASQNFFVVFVAHTPSQPTNVLVRVEVARPSQLVSFFFPVLLGSVGAVMLSYAIRSRSQKVGKAALAYPTASFPLAESVKGSTAIVFCRYCGAALRAGGAFCPSCDRSQT